MRAYLQLVRLPAVFSAAADVFLGFVLAHGSLNDGCPLPFALLMVSSVCLYLAGMVFNDVFDREVDARERPGRPIPSGRVPLRSAVGLGIGLMVAGVVFAAFAGLGSLLVAGLLVAAILGYDSFVKKTPAGPLAMGLCRALNVLLGASAAADFSAVWAHPQLTVAACYGVYIAGITWFARNEAGKSSVRQLAGATAVINAGLLALGFLAVNEWFGVAGEAPVFKVLWAGAALALVVNRGLLTAIADPSPQRVQHAVKTMLQWLVVLDAVLIFAASGNGIYALVTAALMLPAMLFARWISMT